MPRASGARIKPRRARRKAGSAVTSTASRRIRPDVGVSSPADDRAQRRLARAVGAQQRDDLAPRDARGRPRAAPPPRRTRPRCARGGAPRARTPSRRRLRRPMARAGGAAAGTVVTGLGSRGGGGGGSGGGGAPRRRRSSRCVPTRASTPSGFFARLIAPMPNRIAASWVVPVRSAAQLGMKPQPAITCEQIGEAGERKAGEQRAARAADPERDRHRQPDQPDERGRGAVGDGAVHDGEQRAAETGDRGRDREQRRPSTSLARCRRCGRRPPSCEPRASPGRRATAAGCG